MRHIRHTAVLVLAAVGLVSATLAPVVAAGSATQLGSLAGGRTAQTCQTLTAVQESTAAGAPSYGVARAGVLSGWRWEGDAAAGTATARLVVFRPAGTGQWTVVGTSATETLEASTTAVFTTRLKVKVGDRLGFAVTATPSTRCWYAGSAGDTFRFALDTAPPAVGGTFAPTAAAVTSARLSIAADLEPDVDGDGYGDVSQDLCTTQASAGRACDTIPPETTITTRPRSGKARTVRIPFRSSEASSTFVCTLDGAKLATCATPQSVTVQPGKHVFKVRATDRWGNADKTPAVARWTTS